MLYEKDGQSQKDLADGSYKDAPTTSRIIDLLSKKKYLRREAVKENRRQYQVFLTDTGVATVKKAIPLMNEIRIEGWKGLSNADYTKLLDILDKVSSNFDRLRNQDD